ncbi:endonuclease/exonuclease/phosphatase family protein [Hydrogenophaga sp.]|jgi:predicted extracellular nuclease|uniref:endonuclease/exonuclease/phosphatase family protein n=1 Tax=Hydrogenophaga sp. TaxID=1904254 RepID=UPI0025B8E5FD|nr:endonuclease/exonuclease/phosphatase family protein [Hydrogenophaga sp.]MDO9131617.1 endonuclease/exonuclease/phosphatase family protein [Hydrogenophaga sp.]MDO9504453.1 endonuclease/exonuclease/phosphatase family protein [Hydrogenophaga sp.]MDP2985233.1 endonuclease/exonuclease/phosphatase family protein [Hydrogenophaga sp.]MDP3627759.1 endonuclease/exonuclease/phosphatase family protein [Hydrogenophaga sp.]
MNLKQLSIGSFNLYNLNEPGLPMYTDKTGWTQAQYDRKIGWTAHQLQSLDADVFGLQEMWNVVSVQRALTSAGVADNYDLLAPPNSNGKRIDCGALVRKGLLTGQPEWITKFPPGFVLRSTGDDPQTPSIGVNIKGYSRAVLHFTIQPRKPGPEVHVYVCHFKSKGPTQVFNEKWFKADKVLYSKHATGLGAAISTIRRTAEATALRFLLSEQMKGNDTPVIVLGDINDGQHSNTANILTEQPRYLVGESKGGGDTSLYTAQTLQEYRDTRDVYYTHVHQDIRESLDHILVSQEFYDNSKKRLWMFDGLVINNDHLNFEDHKTLGTGDHGIIRATFRYSPAKVV